MSSSPLVPFDKNQLALVSVLASPALGPVLADLDSRRDTLKSGDRLNEQFANGGVALPPGTKVTLNDPGAEGKVSFTVCVAWSDTGPAHCTTVNFQSPITFD